MNKVFLIGNLTRDVELGQTQGGLATAKIGLAVSRDRTNADGEKEVDFFNVKAFGKSAENCGKFLAKGKKIAVVGRVENYSFEDKDGNKRTMTEIIADNIEFLSPKGETEQGQQRPTPTPIDGDDLPF